MKKIILLLIIVLLVLGAFWFVKSKNKAKVGNSSKEEEVVEEVIPDYAYLINDKGIFSKYYQKSYELLKTMTIDEKIGQLFLVRVPEYSAVEELQKYYFGGYLLFDRDYRGQTKDSLVNKINQYQEVSKIPLIIASDEEGGTVTRISRYSALVDHQFKSPQDLYNAGGIEAILEDEKNKNEILAYYGINVNLAPVADVSTDSNDFIYNRALGLDQYETGKYISEVIKASTNSKVSYVLKHFPGYGNNVDTHTGIAIDSRSVDNFKKVDFVPFEDGIKAGAEAVLVNHNIIVNMEDGIPASLSSKVHEVLRSDMKFTGVIMTDDIAMKAIDGYVEKPSVKALLSGNDMIIISDYARGIGEIKAALESGEITEEMIDRAVMRVLAWKYYKGLM